MDVYLMFGGIEAEIISERGSGTLIDGQFEINDARNGKKNRFFALQTGTQVARELNGGVKRSSSIDGCHFRCKRGCDFHGSGKIKEKYITLKDTNCFFLLKNDFILSTNKKKSTEISWKRDLMEGINVAVLAPNGRWDADQTVLEGGCFCMSK